MSAWPIGLSTMFEQVAASFGIAEIRSRERLSDARQTGFAWTERPGVVALAATRHYVDLAAGNPRVAVIIVPRALAGASAQGKALVVADKADELYHHLHLQQAFAPAEETLEVDPSARVDPTAVLRGHVRIGAGSSIGPRAVIAGPAVIGSGVHVDAGAIIGAEGLYAKTVAGVRRHITHFGGVDIGDGAFVHAGAVIVRSALHGEATRLGRGVHVGVQANVGHDARIGDDATLSSHVVVAGRASIGARAWIGASATISNMVAIGDDAQVRLGAVVLQDVPAGGDVSGNFARPHGRNLKRYLQELKS